MGQVSELQHTHIDSYSQDLNGENVHDSLSNHVLQ
jgi:hypothetical protein